MTDAEYVAARVTAALSGTPLPPAAEAMRQRALKDQRAQADRSAFGFQRNGAEITAGVPDGLIEVLARHGVGRHMAEELTNWARATLDDMEEVATDPDVVLFVSTVLTGVLHVGQCMACAAAGWHNPTFDVTEPCKHSRKNARECAALTACPAQHRSANATTTGGTPEVITALRNAMSAFGSKNMLAEAQVLAALNVLYDCGPRFSTIMNAVIAMIGIMAPNVTAEEVAAYAAALCEGCATVTMFQGVDEIKGDEWQYYVTAIASGRKMRDAPVWVNTLTHLLSRVISLAACAVATPLVPRFVIEWARAERVRISDLVAMIVEGAVDLHKRLMKAWQARDYGVLFDPTANNELLYHATRLCASADRDLPYTAGTTNQRLIKVQREGHLRDAAAKLEQVAKDLPGGPEWQAHMAAFREVTKRLAAFRANNYNGSRVRPYNILLVGDVGQGKTTVYKTAIRAFMGAAGMEYDPGMVYVGECTREFHDGYHEYDSVVVFDEMGAVAPPQAGTGGGIFSNILSAIGEAPALVPTASAGQIGATYWSQQMTVMTSNDSTGGAQVALRQPAAFYRRLAHRVTVTAVKEWRKNDGTLDFVKEKRSGPSAAAFKLVVEHCRIKGARAEWVVVGTFHSTQEYYNFVRSEAAQFLQNSDTGAALEDAYYKQMEAGFKPQGAGQAVQQATDVQAVPTGLSLTYPVRRTLDVLPWRRMLPPVDSGWTSQAQAAALWAALSMAIFTHSTGHSALAASLAMMLLMGVWAWINYWAAALLKASDLESDVAVLRLWVERLGWLRRWTARFPLITPETRARVMATLGTAMLAAQAVIIKRWVQNGPVLATGVAVLVVGVLWSRRTSSPATTDVKASVTSQTKVPVSVYSDIVDRTKAHPTTQAVEIKRVVSLAVIEHGISPSEWAERVASPNVRTVTSRAMLPLITDLSHRESLFKALTRATIIVEFRTNNRWRLGVATAIGGQYYLTAGHFFWGESAVTVQGVGRDAAELGMFRRYDVLERGIGYVEIPGRDAAVMRLNLPHRGALHRFFPADAPDGCAMGGALMRPRKTGDRQITWEPDVALRGDPWAKVRRTFADRPDALLSQVAVTDRTFEDGCSGAPALLTAGGGVMVIGPVSGNFIKQGETHGDVEVTTRSELAAAVALLEGHRPGWAPPGLETSEAYATGLDRVPPTIESKKSWIQGLEPQFHLGGAVLGGCKDRVLPRNTFYFSTIYREWQPLRDFVDKYGGDNFAVPTHRPFLTVLPDGTVKWVDPSVIKAEALSAGYANYPQSVCDNALRGYLAAFPLELAGALRPLTAQEAIFGTTKYYKGFDLQRAAGHVGGEPGGIKADWARAHDQWVHPRLLAEIDDIFAAFDAGHPYAPHVVATPKGEQLKVAKVLSGKSRQVWPMQMAFLCVQAMCLAPLMAAFHSLPRNITRCATGLNAADPVQWRDWKLWIRSKAPDGVTCDLDKWEFDSLRRLQNRELLARFFAELAVRAKYPQQWVRRVYYAMLSGAYSIAFIQGVVVWLWQGRASGELFTDAFNSVDNELDARATYELCAMSTAERSAVDYLLTPSYDEAVASGNLGDDTEFSVAPEARGYYNRDAIAAMMAPLGERITAASKEAGAPLWVPADQAEFLKRTVGPGWRAPLATTSIVKSLRLMRKSQQRSEQQVAHDCYLTAQRECFMHGRELFDELQRAMPPHGWRDGQDRAWQLPFLNYDELEREHTERRMRWPEAGAGYDAAADDAEPTDVEATTTAAEILAGAAVPAAHGIVARFFVGLIQGFTWPIGAFVGIQSYIGALAGVVGLGWEVWAGVLMGILWPFWLPQGLRVVYNVYVHAPVIAVFRERDVPNAVATSAELNGTVILGDPAAPPAGKQATAVQDYEQVAAVSGDTPVVPAPHPVGAMDDFLRRPIIIDAFTITAALGNTSGHLEIIQPFALWATSTTVNRRLANCYYGEGVVLRIQIQVAATVQHKGGILVGLIPAYGAWSNNPGVRQASQLAQMHGALISLSGPTVTEFEFPVLEQTERIVLSECQYTGYLAISLIDHLKHCTMATAPSITLTIRAYLDRGTFYSPTDLSPASVTSKELSPGGIISRPASIVARAAGVLSEIPAISWLATPVSMVAGMVSNVAAALGFGRPNDRGPPTRYVDMPGIDFGLGVGADPNAFAGWDDAAAVGQSPAVCGWGTEDEMSFESLGARWHMVYGSSPLAAGGGGVARRFSRRRGCWPVHRHDPGHPLLRGPWG